MRPIIEAREINKMYQIGSQSERYLTFRDRLSRPKTWFSRPSIESFCALRDISFDIFSGESVGIIGKNGAGKSTLLKILSRITPPTSGTVKLRGRVASLLEVGTGFHPELTGRENIFFNGAILGMRKAEIQNKFDEIVDFSGVEQFLDTPLKQYSSGMQLRLAFAVAAHLDSEILLMDEVLAVGDAAFQQKCLGKMDSLRTGEGRTLVIVSHDFGIINRFCEKAILLEDGCIQIFANVIETMNLYKNSNHSTIHTSHKRLGNGKVLVNKITLVDTKDVTTNNFYMGDDICLHIEIISKGLAVSFEIGLNIKSINDEIITHVTTLDTVGYIQIEQNHRTSIKLRLKNIFFSPGTYFLDLFLLKDDEHFDMLYYVAKFDITEGTIIRRGKFPRHVKVFTETEISFY